MSKLLTIVVGAVVVGGCTVVAGSSTTPMERAEVICNRLGDPSPACVERQFNIERTREDAFRNSASQQKPTWETPVTTNPDITASAQTCAERSGYPLGRWGVGTQGATPASYSTFVTFTRPSSGTWLPSSGKGSFETSVTPASGKEIVITLKAEPGTYKSENQLVVSADGCSMSGTFFDSEGHSGEAVYRWQGDSSDKPPPQTEPPTESGRERMIREGQENFKKGCANKGWRYKQTENGASCTPP